MKIRMIMPVYNAGDYLKKAIDSIIGQTLSFRENITIHLIDDASEDDSLAICREYEKRYPKNIRVTHFEQNKGVSAVRNFGLKCSRWKFGTIVGFIDCDDYIENDALEKVLAFFENHKDISLAAMEIHHFGAREDEHKSNWRFEEREIVEIEEDFNFPQYYIGGVFLRRKAYKKMFFDESMNFWEDAMAITRVILNEGRYGLVKGAKYYYRKLENESSLVDRAWRNPERYTTFLEQGYGQMLEYCKSMQGKGLLYVEYLIAYHLRLFLLESNREVVLQMVPKEEMEAFKERLRAVLKNIDDKVIIKMNTALPIIEAELSIKYGKKKRAKKNITEDDLILTYKGTELARLSERSVRVIGWLDKEGYEGMLRGRFSTPIYAMKKDDYIFVEHNGERVESIRYKCKKKLYILDELVRNYKNAGFAVDIPKDWRKLRFGIHTQDIDIMLNEIEISPDGEIIMPETEAAE